MPAKSRVRDGAHDYFSKGEAVIALAEEMSITPSLAQRYLQEQGYRMAAARMAIANKSVRKTRHPKSDAAMALVAETGVSLAVAVKRLRQSGHDLAAARASVHRRHKTHRLVSDGGHSVFKTVTSAAFVLADQTGVPFNACRIAIRTNGHDMVRARAALADQSFGIIDGKHYRNRKAFCIAAARASHVSARKLETWARVARATTPDAVLARAKAMHAENNRKVEARRRAGIAPRRPPFVIFGWRFRSRNAAVEYYGANEDLLRKALKANDPERRCVAFLKALLELWMDGALDEYNRRHQEKWIKPAHRPLNARDARLPVTDPHERKLCKADALADGATSHWSDRQRDEVLQMRARAEAERAAL